MTEGFRNLLSFGGCHFSFEPAKCNQLKACDLFLQSLQPWVSPLLSGQHAGRRVNYGASIWWLTKEILGSRVAAKGLVDSPGGDCSTCKAIRAGLLLSLWKGAINGTHLYMPVPLLHPRSMKASQLSSGTGTNQ